MSGNVTSLCHKNSLNQKRVGGIFTFTMGSGTISQTNTGIVMNCNDSKKNINLDSFGAGF